MNETPDLEELRQQHETWLNELEGLAVQAIASANWIPVLEHLNQIMAWQDFQIHEAQKTTPMESAEQIVQRGFEIVGVPTSLASQMAEILFKEDFGRVGCTPEKAHIFRSAVIWMNTPQPKNSSQHR